MGCRQWAGSGSSIYRSTDQGMTWNQVSEQGGASAPLVASDGTIYWGSDASASFVSSTDQGQTWTELAPSGVLYPNIQPIELPGGRLATCGAGQVVLSADRARPWRAVTASTRYTPIGPVGIVYSPDQKAFFTWHFTCGMGADPVPDDAI